MIAVPMESCVRSPASWTGPIAMVLGGLLYKASFLTDDDEKFEEMKRFELKSGDLIMSCSGTMGKVAIVPANIKKGIINQALLKLTPSKNLDIEYLRYWMSSPDFIQRIVN